MTSPKKLKVQDAKQLLEMDRVLTLHEGQTWFVFIIFFLMIYGLGLIFGWGAGPLMTLN